MPSGFPRFGTRMQEAGRISVEFVITGIGKVWQSEEDVRLLALQAKTTYLSKNRDDAYSRGGGEVAGPNNDIICVKGLIIMTRI